MPKRLISRFLPRKLRCLLKVKVPARPPSFALIDQPDQLAPLLDALDHVDEVALDTEADNMYHYQTRVCLLQLMVDGNVYLVDLMVPLPLEELWAKLSTKHLVMHGSDFDIRLLSELCQFRPKSLFDTMLAAQLLNRQRVGLAALLEEHFGVVLDKAGQKANWSKRPLTAHLLDYASLDVWHLFELRDILTRELVRLDRIEWLDQQCQRQIESGIVGFPRDDAFAWRIGQADRLRGRGLGALYELWHWRDEWARKLDVPPFKVCGNANLFKMAQAAEEGDAVASITSKFHLGKRHKRLEPTLTTALEKGVAHDPRSLPRRPRGERNPLSVEEIALQDRIKATRDDLAKKLDLDPTLIANRTQLAQIARLPEKVSEILLPWQVELLKSDPSLKLG